MDISGSLTHLIRAELELPEKARQPFRVGDTLQLRVLEVISANRVRVGLGKFQALADVQFPVAPGDKLKVEVEAVDKQLRLRAVVPQDASTSSSSTPAKPSAQYLSRYAGSLGQEISRVLAQLQTGASDKPLLPDQILNALKAVAAHLEPLQPQADVQSIAERLKGRVESSGLFLEKKLEQVVSGLPKEDQPLPAEILRRADRLVRVDLKAQLMVLQRYFESATSNAIERLTAEGSRRLNQAVAGLLADITDQQTNTRQTDPNQLFHVVLFDLPIKDSGKNGLLKMYFPKHRRTRKRNSFRLSVLLSLDRLGEIRSDFVMQEKELTLMFFVARNRAKKMLESQISVIEEALTPYFDRVAVSVALAVQKLEEFETDVLQVNGDKKIDMRV